MTTFTPPYIGAIDQGTTSTRFILFDKTGTIVSSHQTEYEQIYPRAGWCEHDPLTIYKTVQTCINETVKKLPSLGVKIEDIKAVGITNQRETTVVWDSETGKSLHNAIVWLDTRTRDLVDTLIESTPTKSKDYFQRTCGLPFSTYFSAVKLKWLLENVPEVADASERGTLRFGTIDSWLLYNLTGGCSNNGVHMTDVTNASRTMLMNLKTLQWDKSICSFFGIQSSCLPQIKSSAQVYGYIDSGALKGVAISGCLGDQQAALVGHRCFQPGEAKNTYGTGCFMLYNTGTTPIPSHSGLLTTVGYQLGPNSPVHYALEGSIAIAGAAVKWLRDNMGLISDSAEINELASKVTSSSGVMFVPAFSGLFAPYWRDDARGVIVGLTQYTTKAHIARATLEAVCFQTREILDAMGKDVVLSQAEESSQDEMETTEYVKPTTGLFKVLKVDGGMTNSDVCMGIQADVVGIPIERPIMRESTAFGAALAAGHAIGIWPDLSRVEFPHDSSKDVFNPRMKSVERERNFRVWKRAVERSFGWTKVLEEAEESESEEVN